MNKKSALLLALAAGLSAQAAPVFNAFELGVQSGRTAQYDAVGENNIRTSIQNEKGTLAMYSVKQKADPDMAYMFEIYADEAAYQTHAQSPQYRAFLAVSPKILTDHKQRIALTPVFLGDKKIRPSETSRINLERVEVKPQHSRAFARAVTAEMVQSLKAEKGVLAMYAATEQDNPNKWLFFEIYADDAAYETHRETPHFQHYLKQTAAMIADRQTIDITPAYLGNQGGLLFHAPEP
ncbi:MULTISPECIES: putative quinol monooxygenase [unclassified Neisseria]|uniref:putative quinol monooxygenase n=1 Tax=unclassified Neisseria TaxID=2623750 RepID=UPI0010724A75|nr:MULTISPECIES: antibiotic biosynthesis monooxygenase [unclassified Neisseria]MBF0803956.1 antibiotic biosynthesis monooxygenase [Neisseria sp. 19428wB4_WF04]TFU43297.1 antibiotic biosynthesis monooxygenase [Neisseria sp. WF04]